MTNKKVLIITGPTASGKTQLSEIIQPELDGEIINADLGQFYKPLSIGTAKPNLETVNYKHHLFDIINEPDDLSVVRYRQLVGEKVNHIFSQGKTPIIVGGSLFYIKSLFFPPAQLEYASEPVTSIDLDVLSNIELRELLQRIDPNRAKEIHENDIYRTRRALDIWKMTGQKPSNYKPCYAPLFDALIVFVCPATDILNQRIRLRTEQMIKIGGWIEEAKSLLGTNWESFVVSKGLIGYAEIFKWLGDGVESEKLDELINIIQIKTCQYAKRQRTFWQSFNKQLGDFVKNLEVSAPNIEVKNQIIKFF